MSWFSSSDPQCCSGGEGAEVRGGLREWVVSILFGSGGAGPERPFLLVWVLGVARAVWVLFGGVLVIRSCDLLLVWVLVLLLLGGSRGSGGVFVCGSVPGVFPGCRCGASQGSPSSGCWGRLCIVRGVGAW